MYVEAITLDLNNASEDWGEGLKPLPIPSLPSQSPAAAFYVTPPLNPVPCTTREPSADTEATTPDLTIDKPAWGAMPEEMLQEL